MATIPSADKMISPAPSKSIWWTGPLLTGRLNAGPGRL